jgi:hypothetical protein
MEEAFTRALEFAQRAGDPREQGWILRMLALVYYHGPTPVDVAGPSGTNRAGATGGRAVVVAPAPGVEGARL